MPDQIEIALAAAGQLEWALRMERARYEAERARRQYDAVEPENRLVARSLERAGKTSCVSSRRSSSSLRVGARKSRF